MKKVYEPLNMIMNGRYAVLYGKLAPVIQQEILVRMAELIEEERDYEDKGNYGHFCNILPTIAIDDVLQRSGKSADEAFFWGILEMHQQEQRVVKGWFPENPKRHDYYESLRKKSLK